MKYYKELYIDSGIYGCEEEGMSCRKSHVCASCGKEIPKGEQAVNESGFLYGEVVSRYTCLKCIEQWLKESGLVDSELEE